MKKLLISSFFTLALLASLPSDTLAENATFTTSLQYGVRNSAKVMELQNFLIAQGFLDAKATGNYLAFTRKAVAAFQSANGIEAIGIFGPLTRSVANKILLAANTPVVPTVAPATVSVTSVEDVNFNTATAFFSNEKLITWKTSGFPASARVTINLLRKMSDNSKPYSFSFFKVIAANTPNDNQEKWMPSTGETASNMYVEVVCSSIDAFPSGCRSFGEPIQITK